MPHPYIKLQGSLLSRCTLAREVEAREPRKQSPLPRRLDGPQTRNLRNLSNLRIFNS
jgi:hypothetical protein